MRIFFTLQTKNRLPSEQNKYNWSNEQTLSLALDNFSGLGLIVRMLQALKSH